MRPSRASRLAGHERDYRSGRGLPGIIVILLAINALVYAIRFVLPTGMHEALMRFLAIVPQRLAAADPANIVETAHELMTFMTHAFVHADLAHLIFNSLWLLIFGTIMASRLNAGRLAGGFVFMCYYLSSAVFAGIVFVLLSGFESVLLIGASGALSAMMAGAVRIAFRRPVPGFEVASPPLALFDRRVIGVTLVYVLLNAAIATPLGPLVFMTDDPGKVAWEVHIAGYLYGLVTMPFFDRLAGNDFRAE